MLAPETLGVVMAEREYALRDGDGGTARAVWLRFGTPVHFPDSVQNY
ncbi:MAG: hypothetical protein JWN04_3040 [Myxococcaceae bacterium]|nr:hypothetical protein [Myxococcaceae bacterium]